MLRWKGNRKRRSVGQRWNGACRGAADAVRRAVPPVLAVLVGFTSVVGGDWAWRTVADSPRFRLNRVDVAGASGLPEGEVLAACGLALGTTRVLGLDVHEVEAACEADPRIRRARVEADLPDGLSLLVEEQVPVMAVATLDGLWMVNRYHEAYAPWDPMDVRDLPLLVGAPEPVEPGEVADRDLLRDAVALLRTVGDAGPFGTDLVVEHDAALGFRLAPSSRGLAARFGQPPFPLKMKRLQVALDAVKDRGMPVAEALLDDRIRPDRVTLRLGGYGPYAEADRGDGAGRAVP